MTTNTDDVLTAIDHALADYDTSADAMRWTAEPAKSQPTQFIELGSGSLVIFASLTDFMAALRTAMLGVTPALTTFSTVVSTAVQPLTQLLECLPLQDVDVFLFVPRRVNAARQQRLATQLRRRNRRRIRRARHSAH